MFLFASSHLAWQLPGFCTPTLGLKCRHFCFEIRLEWIHSKGIIHNDIRAENVLIGRGEDANSIYLIDFGLAHEVQLDDDGDDPSWRDDLQGVGRAPWLYHTFSNGIILPLAMIKLQKKIVVAAGRRTWPVLENSFLRSTNGI